MVDVPAPPNDLDTDRPASGRPSAGVPESGRIPREAGGARRGAGWAHRRDVLRRACPTEPERRALRSRWVDVAILTFAVTYVLGRVVVPRLIEALPT